MAVFAGQWGPEGIDYPNGQHAANTPFEVRTKGGVLIPLYDDKEQLVPRDNPGTTDELGNLYFHATPGGYNLIVGGTFTIPIVIQVHPDEEVSGGGGPISLDNLYDVEAINIPQSTPLEWRRDSDGVYRLIPATTNSGEVQGLIDDTLAVHVQAAEPHNAYDDLPSLRLLFENGLI